MFFHSKTENYISLSFNCTATGKRKSSKRTKTKTCLILTLDILKGIIGLQYWLKSTLLLLKKSSWWFKIISGVLLSKQFKTLLYCFIWRRVLMHLRSWYVLYRYIDIQSTLDISNCQGTNKFVRDIESSTYRVVILCKLIRLRPIVLCETSSIGDVEIQLYNQQL